MLCKVFALTIALSIPALFIWITFHFTYPDVHQPNRSRYISHQNNKQSDYHAASDQPHYQSESNIHCTQTQMYSVQVHFKLLTQLKAHNFSFESLGMLWLLDFPSLELKGPNMLQHDCAPVHKANSMSTWFERKYTAQNPDLNSAEHFGDKMECSLCTESLCPTSVCPTLLMLLWMNGQKFLAVRLHISRKPSQKRSAGTIGNMLCDKHI